MLALRFSGFDPKRTSGANPVARREDGFAAEKGRPNFSMTASGWVSE
jgi:hypothetical protein